MITLHCKLGVPDCIQQLEIRGSKICLHCMQIIDETREESEERFLLANVRTKIDKILVR